MKLTMKYPRFKNENPIKALGNRYEIDNEIPKFQEWKIHWKLQGIDMKFIMKSTEVWNKISVEKAGEWIWNWQWNPPSYQNEIDNEWIIKWKWQSTHMKSSMRFPEVFNEKLMRWQRE